MNDKATKARVIADFDEHKIDDLVTGEVAAAGIAGGWADGHPDAVKHAEKLAARAKAKADEAEDAA